MRMDADIIFTIRKYTQIKGVYVKNIKRKLFGIILGILAVTAHVSALAEGLILTGPPRETPEAGMKMYGPIAAHLTESLGVPVTYKHPGNWLRYHRDMRSDKYDIVFDGPHFMAWRIEHLGHEALVKLPGKLQFMLVYPKDGEKFKHPDDLIGKKICGLSNLSTLSILDYYRNPVRQPIMKGVKGGMKKVYTTLIDKKSKCSAGVLRTAFFKKKLKKEQQAKLETLILSKAMPNQGITVSQRVSQKFKDIIATSLTIGKGVASTKNLRKRFAGKAKGMLPTKPKEYDGFNMLLEGIIFGW